MIVNKRDKDEMDERG